MALGDYKLSKQLTWKQGTSGKDHFVSFSCQQKGFGWGVGGVASLLLQCWKLNLGPYSLTKHHTKLYWQLWEDLFPPETT